MNEGWTPRTMIPQPASTAINWVLVACLPIYIIFCAWRLRNCRTDQYSEQFARWFKQLLEMKHFDDSFDVIYNDKNYSWWWKWDMKMEHLVSILKLFINVLKRTVTVTDIFDNWNQGWKELNSVNLGPLLGDLQFFICSDWCPFHFLVALETDGQFNPCHWKILS